MEEYWNTLNKENISVIQDLDKMIWPLVDGKPQKPQSVDILMKAVPGKQKPKFLKAIAGENKDKERYIIWRGWEPLAWYDFTPVR